MAALNVLSLLLYIDKNGLILQHGVLHILALNKTRLDLSIPNELVNVVDYIIRSDRESRDLEFCIISINWQYIKMRLLASKAVDSA